MSDFVLSDYSTLITAVLCLFLAHQHFLRGRRSNYRQVSRYVRAFNWFIFACAFVYITVANIDNNTLRTTLRMAGWLILAGEIGYNLLYFDNNNGPAK